jgi:hypothetical protein
VQEQTRRRVLMQQQLSNNFGQRFQPVSFAKGPEKDLYCNRVRVMVFKAT